eukprot:TRINITY_DN10338_c0_g1_i2.p1 TRINITY_DN10338_c0_g1~~TRINITY_DN10338_c0_g1_i2.p1  ORF type:complete len:275 (+),score=70.65 TRINITY_DN10338_c0_g1_i2:39-827(+)
MAEPTTITPAATSSSSSAKGKGKGKAAALGANPALAQKYVDGQMGIHIIIPRMLNATIDAINAALAAPNAAETLPAQGKLLLEHARSIWSVIHAHHHHEEEFIFSTFGTKSEQQGTTVGKLKDDHETLMADLNELDALTAPASIPRDVAEMERAIRNLLQVLTRIRDFLIPHFEIENNAFNVEFLTAHATDKEIHTIEKQIDASLKKIGTPVMLAGVYYSLTKEERKVHLGNLPFIVTGFLIPRVWKGKYKQYIQFYPYYTN